MGDDNMCQKVEQMSRLLLRPEEWKSLPDDDFVECGGRF